MTETPARSFAKSRGSGRVFDTVGRRILNDVLEGVSISLAMSFNMLSMTATSPTAGTLVRVDGLSISKVAASTARVAFLDPEI
jgi:hypothetical protein